MRSYLVPFVAAAPALGWAAIVLPRTIPAALVVVTVGFLLLSASLLVPRAAGPVVGWWMLACTILVFPLIGLPYPSSRLAGWAGAVLAVWWWVVLLAEPVRDAVTSAFDEWRGRGTDPPDSDVDDTEPAAPKPVFSGPLRIPDAYRAVPLGVDRVRPPETPEPGIADVLLDAWPDGATALHLDEVADLLRMSGASSRDVRDALESEGVKVQRRVGRRREGQSISKPGVRREDVEEASQRDRDPSRGVTTA